MARRDRRGRGMRGPLAWPPVPAMVSRSAIFDDLVLDCADRLKVTLERTRADLEFAVEDVPPGDPAPWEEQVAPLSRLFPGQGRLPARIVLYRRPIEAQARDEQDLAALVRDVIFEQVASYLGIPPTDLP